LRKWRPYYCHHKEEIEASFAEDEEIVAEHDRKRAEYLSRRRFVGVARGHATQTSSLLLTSAMASAAAAVREEWLVPGGRLGGFQRSEVFFGKRCEAMLLENLVDLLEGHVLQP
jgi:hypothetical protein